MPLYEYKCGQCGFVFEKLVGVSGAGETPLCPACGSDKCEKQFSVFASNVTGSSVSSSRAGNCGSCNSPFT